MGDYSDTMYLQCIGEVGDAFIGMTAKDFAVFALENPEGLKKQLYRRMFQDYTVLIRANMQQSQNYGDTIRYSVSKVLPDSFAESNADLLKKLSLYKTK